MSTPATHAKTTPSLASARDPVREEFAVSLRGLTKVFGGTTVVDALDLDVSSGEFFSLLGPSGCGKTTTLRMIAGFNDPTSGSVMVGGEDVTSTPPHKRDVNTVFQSYALFEHLDVRRNVGFGLRRKGVDRAGIDSRVSEMLELVELGPRAHDRPSELSGGQRQRVALARAIAVRPRVLLLDDPLSALDVTTEAAVTARLRDMLTGTTTLVVAHRPSTVALADRVAVLEDGRITGVGRHADLLTSHPHYRYVLTALSALDDADDLTAVQR